MRTSLRTSGLAAALGQVLDKPSPLRVVMDGVVATAILLALALDFADCPFNLVGQSGRCPERR
jgi:hypothetical protein